MVGTEGESASWMAWALALIGPGGLVALFAAIAGFRRGRPDKEPEEEDGPTTFKATAMGVGAILADRDAINRLAAAYEKCADASDRNADGMEKLSGALNRYTDRFDFHSDRLRDELREIRDELRAQNHRKK